MNQAQKARERMGRLLVTVAWTLWCAGLTATAEAAVLVSNIEFGSDGFESIHSAARNSEASLAFTTGPQGGSVTSVVIRLRNSRPESIAAPSVTLHEGTVNGEEITIIGTGVTLTGPTMLSSGKASVTWTAPANTVLQASTRYFLILKSNASAEGLSGNDQILGIAVNSSGTLDEVKLIRFGGHPDTVQRRCPMSKTHSPYAPEYRRQMVELVRTGRTPGELAREFECSAQAIRNWVRQAERDDGRREDGLTTVEREELRRLRREVRQLREEREILAKATAWFARETGSVRARSSSS